MRIFFVISKAFDKIWHGGLIYKVIYLKAPMYIIEFIKSFLDDLIFRGRVSECYSEPHSVTCYVSQESVLDLLLFLVYINDIPVFKLNKI